MSCPGNSATAEVMLAARGGSPLRSSTGKVKNEPPPASEFYTPAMNPTMASTASLSRTGAPGPIACIGRRSVHL